MKKNQLVGTVFVALLILFPLLENSFAETLKGTIRVDGSSTVFPFVSS